MVTFDRIKTISPINIVNDFNPDVLENLDRMGISNQYNYDSSNWNLPFKVHIKINFERNELVMDLPAKLLFDNYPDLISKETIEQLIINLNSLDIIQLDYEDWYHSSKMIACDVTRDIKFPICNIGELDITNQIKNPSRWLTESYFNGYEFNKRNHTRNRRINFKIYGKDVDMISDRNQYYLNYMDDSDAVMDRFKDVTRFEMELRSFELLRRYFETDNLSLKPIIESPSDPIKTLVEEVFDLDGETSTMHFKVSSQMTYSQFKEHSVARVMDYDLAKIDDALKQVLSPKTKRPVILKRYRGIINKMIEQNSSDGSKTVHEFFKQLLAN